MRSESRKACGIARLTAAQQLAKVLGEIILAGFFLGAASLVQAQEGVTPDTILIGQTVGVSGQIAGPVKEMMAGAGAYFAAINKGGGIHGRKINLRVLDDKFDPTLAAANAAILIKQEHVLALFQSRGTPHTEAILPLLAAHKLPLIAPSTGATMFHQPMQRYVFNVRAKYQDEVAKAVEQFSTIGLTEIALLHVDDSFGRDGLAGFEKAMAQHKLRAVGIHSYDRAKPDVDGVVRTVLQSDPKALIIVGSAGTTAELITKLRAQNARIALMTLSNNAAQSFVDALGPQGYGVMMSQIMPAPNSLSSVLGQEFKLIAQSAGVKPSYAAMEGFVAAKVLVLALKRSGRDLSRETLIRALESMQRVDLGGLMLSYSESNHSGSEFVELTMIGKEGKFLR